MLDLDLPVSGQMSDLSPLAQAVVLCNGVAMTLQEFATEQSMDPERAKQFLADMGIAVGK